MARASEHLQDTPGSSVGHSAGVLEGHQSEGETKLSPPLTGAHSSLMVVPGQLGAMARRDLMRPEGAGTGQPGAMMVASLPQGELP